MMTFYAAAGSYQIRSEDGKNMPYIMRLGKLQPVSIPEFSLWSKVEPVGPSVDDAALALIALRFLEGFLQKRCGVEISGSVCADLLGQKNR